jgi:Helix-turn-helix domain
MKGRKKKSRDMKTLLAKEVFTTFDAALICQMNIASIKNWISKGYLRAFRTPGGHFRIQKRDFISFLRKYHMPNPFAGETYRLYLYAMDTKTIENVAEKLKADHESFAFGTEADLFLAIGEETPDALIVDVDTMDAAATEAFIGYLASNTRFEGIRLIALSSETETVPGFVRTVKKHGAAKRIVTAIQEIY